MTKTSLMTMFKLYFHMFLLRAMIKSIFSLQCQDQELAPAHLHLNPTAKMEV